MKNIVLILAAGSGNRFNHHIPKQFHLLDHRTMLEVTIEKFNLHPLIQEIYVVTHPLFIDLTNDILFSSTKTSKIMKVISGGKSRFESVYMGLKVIPDKEANILIHDSNRPLVTDYLVSRCLEHIVKCNAVFPYLSYNDTLYQMQDGSLNPIDRRTIIRAQTPQCFRLSIIRECYKKAKYLKINDISDDINLFVKIFPDEKIKFIHGEVTNFKITIEEELQIARALLQFNN